MIENSKAEEEKQRRLLQESNDVCAITFFRLLLLPSFNLVFVSDAMLESFSGCPTCGDQEAREREFGKPLCSPSPLSDGQCDADVNEGAHERVQGPTR